MKKLFSLFAITLLTTLTTFAAEKADRRDPRRDDRPAAANREKIDINTADAATLETLPGVGPVIAQEIIAKRPFKNAAELKDINGIGEVRFGEIRPLITVSHKNSTATRESKKADKEARKAEKETEKEVRKNERSSSKKSRPDRAAEQSEKEKR